MLRIVEATVDRGWDGVDFDDECNMNTERVIEAMKRLKEARKETSPVLLPAIPTIIPIRKMVKAQRESQKNHPVRPVRSLYSLLLCRSDVEQ